MNTVYASQGGRRYHATAACKALRNAQDLSDWDCWDDYCRHDHPRPRPVREMTTTDALGAGKWPCAVCWPNSAAALAISPSEHDYGHEPTYMDLGSCGMGGCQCPGHYDAEVCARCVIVEYETSEQLVTDEHGNDQYVHGRWVIRRDPVLWPCTSAIVLGLAPRPAPAA